MSASIVVAGLGKAYRRYARPWHRLAEWLSGGRLVWHETFWALRGVSFAVAAGESLGIIGLNGAGKSTLLKILTGTTQPTEGQVRVEGKTAALLELGLGFHPDFTGRLNALVAGQIMGFSAQQMIRLMPVIEEFAEIGEYIDQPIRTYSTGMVVRLAFSLATAVRPDGLIVDEALAVGDAYFQQKCLRRIKDVRAAGTTIIFVSHDAGAVKALCDRCILLDRGQIVADGRSDAVLDLYNALIAKRDVSQRIFQSEASSGRTITRSGTFEARMVDVDLLAPDGGSARAFTVGEEAQVRCRVEFAAPVAAPTVGFLIRDRLGNDLFGTNTHYLGGIEGSYEAGDELEVGFELPLNLGLGRYTLTVAVHSHATHLLNNYDWWDRVIEFEVVPGPQPVFIGSSWLPVRVRAEARKRPVGQASG